MNKLRLSTDSFVFAASVILSIALFVFAFPPADVPEGAYLFLVPLFLYSAWRRTDKIGFGSCFLIGWISWILLIRWIRNFTNHIEAPLAGAVGWIALFGLAAICALFFAAWVFVALRCFQRSLNHSTPVKVMAVLGLSGFWVGLEWLRSWIFTGFPWLPLSATQWERPLLLQISSWTGHYGVSFILVSFNLGLSYYIIRMWENRKEKWYRRLCPEFYTTLACLFFAIGFGLHSIRGPYSRSIEIETAFVQPAIPSAEKWDSDRAQEAFETIERLTRLSSYLKPNLIVWPESPTPFPLKGNDGVLRWTEDLIESIDIPILMGNIAVEGDPYESDSKWYNSVFLVEPGSGVQLDDYYSKRKLVPFGEYIPLGSLLSFLDKVVPLPGNFHHGQEATLLSTQYGDHRIDFGPLVCYEDIFPQLARTSVLEGADVLFVTTNDYWFGESGAAEQHAAHSVLRSVELRRPVIRSGNAGWSGWIDEAGAIRHITRDDSGSIFFQGTDSSTVKVSLYWKGRLTFFAKHGSWFVAVSMLLFGLFLVLLWKSPRNRIGKVSSNELKPTFSLRRD